ncbi:DUF1761 domain-containing protein [Metabacillus indicus]|uniref:DUF1761 domain-containing protein n=1 Tax=Metabacillus indicus TaxID=246786 RepID=UPI003CE8351F
MFEGFNIIAVLAGGLLYMAFGAFYYSPLLFGKAWTSMHPGGVKDSVKYTGSAVIALLTSFLIFTLIQLTGADGAGPGLLTGLIVGAVLALAYLKNTLFGLMNWKSYVIAVLDHVIACSLLGVLHGLWN